MEAMVPTASAVWAGLALQVYKPHWLWDLEYGNLACFAACVFTCLVSGLLLLGPKIFIVSQGKWDLVWARCIG